MPDFKHATSKIVVFGYDKDGGKPVRIRISFSGKSKYYPAGTDARFSDSEFAARRKKDVMKALDAAECCLKKAKNICEILGDSFNWDDFESTYKEWYRNRDIDEQQSGDSIPIYNMTSTAPAGSFTFAEVLDEYLLIADIGTSTVSLYRTLRNWVERFSPGIAVSSIDVDYVSIFKKFVKSQHLKDQAASYREKYGSTIPQNKVTEMSENTLRIYLRDMRAIINYAIDKGYYTGKNPVKALKRQPLTSIPRQKAALDEKGLSRFIKYEPRDKYEELGKDFFLATIQASGANLIDILKITNKDLSYSEINYRRSKSRKSGLITTFPVTRPFAVFLSKYGVIAPNQPDDYILPYLVGARDEKAIKGRVHRLDVKINKGLHSIFRNLKMKDMTLYNARHTYASLASGNGLGIESIQKFLGHTDYKTTQIYLSSIMTSVKDKNRNMLDELVFEPKRQ